MRTSMFLGILLFFHILSTACSSPKSTEMLDTQAKGSVDQSETNSPPPPPPPPSMKKESITESEKNTGNDNSPIPKKIIKNANIRMKVNNYTDSKKKFYEIIKKWNADKVAENEVNSDYGLNNSVTIRINCDKFEAFVDEICTVASVLDQKNISSNDVTEEFVDVQTRLRNKKLVEERYSEILKQARTIPEILEVENHLRQIREEIEAKEGRLKYLNSQVDFSTVQVEIYQNYKQIYRGFWGQLWDGMEAGWRGLLYFIIGVFSLWPMWLIVGAIIWFVFYLRKKRKMKQA